MSLFQFIKMCVAPSRRLTFVKLKECLQALTSVPVLQVGVTAMLIAAKYEEIYAPNIEEFCYITDNTYSRGDVRSPSTT